MSLKQTSRLIRSSVFRWTMATAIGLLIVTAGIWGLATWWNFQQNEKDLKERILEEHERLSEILEDDDQQTFNEELILDEQTVWHDDQVYEAAEEEEFVFRLSEANGEFLLGYREIQVEEGWLERIEFDHELEQQLTLHTQRLPNDQLLTIGLFDSHEMVDSTHIYLEALRLYTLIYIPITLILGYLLSRAIFGRLDQMKRSMDRITQTVPDKRLPISKKKDEFDRLSSNINAMLNRLKDMGRSMDDASIGIAHDLKTPISHLSNQLELMQQDINDRDALLRHIENSRTEIENVLDTFDALLRLGEIDSGTRSKYFSPVDLSELATEIAESYEPVFADSSKELKVSVVPGLKVKGDASLLTQMVSNLLENAIVHSKAHSITWVRLQGSEQGIILQIGDNGPGIPETAKTHVFERFYRADQSRTKPGNGLGLSLVKSICTLHNARITLLEHQPGTVFDIVFPYGL